MFSVCVCAFFCVSVQVCDDVIIRPRSPTECLRSSELIGAVAPKEK
jgi:hypothetical protein